MSCKFVAAALCFALVGIMATGGAAPTIGEKCAGELNKVAQCLAFVTAKVATPSKDCCDSVTEMKESDPACLCYMIQQIHNGTSAVKSMGVQETRLLQLPSACKLVNASISECPKLLNLAPNSTDAAIFTNATSATTVTTPVGTPDGTTAVRSSRGEWVKPQVAGIFTVALTMFFLAFTS